MANELPKQYDPKATEDTWYQFWEENEFFSARPNPGKKPFSIVIPPPNVTGILHMGHALNNTLQDILIRYHRMQGDESLWMPGTDHAGIATQNVVEKTLAKEGLKRQDLGREKFIERVWAWKEEYGSTIIRQLKKLGASCDWARTRFTMDAEYSQAVIEAFVRLFELGLIYQGNYIINWCPRCQTALSDEEAPHKQLQGNLYYIRYPLKEDALSASHCEEAPALPACREGRRSNPKKRDCFAPSGLTMTSSVNYVVVATTRPETMLGDTAVAVNPKDKRYKHLIGESIVLPLVNREIKIIADEMVDAKFGTGAVKVTPAHDPNDYALGKKHKLDFLNVMHADGRMNENAGDYRGLERFQAREAILEDLNKKGLLEKVQPHQLSAGHCYRCQTIIEPYLSKQWFVKMKPLSRPAVEAVKIGKIKFHPRRWTKVYLNWMQNLQDWCISRQIWWGHRLPVYYCKGCLEQANGSRVKGQGLREKPKTKDKQQTTNNQQGVIVSRIKPEKCPTCGSGEIYQDEDVLDTWFSSWLWPFATFGWPNVGSRVKGQGSKVNKIHSSPCTLHPAPSDIEYFYPTSVLVTAPEIIFFWVARMIMAGFEFMKDVPFRDIYIHGTVRDIEGKKMSKSLGNIIDPLAIINEFGADALRFSLISSTAQGQDVFLSREKFEQGRNFANKIWNASRLILMNREPAQAHVDLCVFFKKESLNLQNRWILSRFYSLLKEVNANLGSFKFNEAANLLYSFFWHEFCDWYLEIIKPDIKHPQNQVVMYKILEKFLRILHPFMPFLTEDLWQKLNNPLMANQQPPATSIMIQPWPHVQEGIIDKTNETLMQSFFEVITTIRNMRAELEIPVQDNIAVAISSPHKPEREILSTLAPIIKRLAKIGTLEINQIYARAPGQYTGVLKDMHIVIPLSGIIDIATHRKIIEEKIAKAESEIKRKNELLDNVNFSKNAPGEIVEKEKSSLNEFKELLKKLKAVKDALR